MEKMLQLQKKQFHLDNAVKQHIYIHNPRFNDAIGSF